MLRARELLAVASNEARAFVLVGDVCVRAGRRPEARTYYVMALQLEPDHVNALCRLGQLARDDGECGLALDAFRRAVRLEPFEAALHHELARLYDDLGRAGEAERHWRLVRECGAGTQLVGDAVRRLGATD